MTNTEVDTRTTDAASEDTATSDLYVGNKVDEVRIDIDYAIVKHFSEHLYSSPNKAIEELVSNGFDALATLCYVYVPGKKVQNRVLVWDNGLSMDPSGLQAMWQIAKSPKEDLGENRTISGKGKRRAVIGKFGIGKLASYAVGHRISHFCKTPDGRYLSVSVNYRNFTAAPVPHSNDPEPVTAEGNTTVSPSAADSEVRASTQITEDLADVSRTPIRELSAEQMEELVRELLPEGDAVGVMLAQEHWTLAVIDDLKDVTLYPARLGWVLGNGMPLRPDFKVYVEDVEVESKLEKNAAVTWQLDEQKLQDSMRSSWKEGLSKGLVSGEPTFTPPMERGSSDSSASNTDTRSFDDPDAVGPSFVLPTLGKVQATVRIFEDSLAIRGEAEGRSYGFFLSVRGRLINPDDEKLLLSDPSFGTFYRSQYEIKADGLDADLLADRESLRRDTPMTRELKVLQTALYRAARSEVEKQDEVKQKTERPESRLPVRSRELFRDPLTALIARSADRSAPVNFDEPVIERLPLDADQHLAQLDTNNGHLQVNRNHPFYRAIEAQAGSGKKAAATMRAFDLFAVAERLTEGFLYGRGVPEDQVSDLLAWRDKLLRSLAVTYNRNPDDAVLELRAASVEGGKRFELAIAEILNLMGFTAVRDGASGREDVLVTAPLGPNHEVFIAEGKGSKDPVVNVTAALSGAAAHRDAVGAAHAIVVAREFAGFKNKDEPAILNECHAVDRVSVVTVETLVSLYYALLKYAYPLESIMRALFVIETPKDKAKRVAELDEPLEDFNFGDVLNEIWKRQSGESQRDQVPVRTLWQSNSNWRERLTYEEFSQKIAALDHFGGRLLVFDANEKTVYLKHHPDKVIEHVQRSLAPMLADTAP